MPPPAANTPGNRLLPHILTALLVATAPHVVHLPVWVVLWLTVLWSYALGAAQGRWPFPRRVLRQVLTLTGVLAGIAYFRFSFDLDVGVGLLGLMMGLKPLEIRSHRDRMITLFLGYFMVITNLLYTNSLGMTLYMLASVCLTTAVLIRINQDGTMKRHLKTSARIMIQAIPLALCLFILFPRLQGGLWGRPRNPAGTTGFTNRLAPGSVIDIVKDKSIAFRAQFEGTRPKPNQLYWRGIVFDHFDGRGWNQRGRSLQPPPRISGDDPVTTTIILQPHYQRWLFALDLPVKNPPGTRILGDHTLFSRHRVRSIFQYRVTSLTGYKADTTLTAPRGMLALPPAGNDKARSLARKWAAASSTPEEIIQKALTFFHENRFRYSLQSPLSGGDIIDQFLFSTKKGYCEHYASAMAFLMRSAGVPARIVGGYLGGEKNPYGEYVIVRQSDAHAWVEVWTANRGWIRVDPTSTVAPARVDQGMAAALAPEERQAFEPYSYLGPMTRYWRAIDFRWDLINNRWNQWVLGYTFDRQRQIYSEIGISSGGWRAIVTALFLLAVLSGLYVAWLAISSRRRPTSTGTSRKEEIPKIYNSFCKKMAAVGLPKEAGQGPADYRRMIHLKRPDLTGEVEDITSRYIRLRYGRNGDSLPVKPFRKAVKRFRPGKQPPRNKGRV